jgi:hypothetical protein
VLGSPGFRKGINLPWIRYGCDFGANAWQPAGGLAARGVPDTVKRLFDRLAKANAGLVRWFLLTDGRAGIRFDGTAPAGIDACLIDDVDAALQLAQATGVQLLFTLFDFHWCHDARIVNGVQLGGHRRVFSKSDLRAALIENVLTPLLRAVGRHPHIAGWDIINEPEWVTGGVTNWAFWSGMRKRDMRAVIGEIAGFIHVESPHPVTVGSASARWLGLVRNLPLDFYQVHWYDQIEGNGRPDALLARDLDKPVMLGEFATSESRLASAEVLGMAERAGYFAALPWSALADDRFSAGPDEICRVLTDEHAEGAPTA